MSDPVNVTRPDGSTFQATPEEAEALQRDLGYGEESEDARFDRNVEEGREDYYTSTEQQIKTVFEGGLSGISLGLTDLGTEALGWDSAERAGYNPGKRLASEIVGGVGAALVNPASLAGKAVAATPAGALSALARRGATAVEGRVAKGVVAGSIEGAGIGAGAEVTNAALSGDPLSAEAVIAGMGWGALWGGGLGGIAAKAGAVAEGVAAKRAAENAGSHAEIIAPERWGAFRSSVDDARKVASEAVETVNQQVKAARIPPTPEEAATAIFDAVESTRESTTGYVNRLTSEGRMAGKGVREAKEETLKTLRRAQTAASNGNTARFESALAEHKAQMDVLASLTGIEAPEMAQFALNKAAAAEDALLTTKALRDVDTALKGIPLTADGFAATSAKKMERHVEAIDTLMKTGGAELDGVRNAVKTAISDMTASAGVKFDGGPAQQLQALWETTRSAKKAGRGSNGVMAKAMRYVAGSTGATALGRGGPVGRAVGYATGTMVAGLLGLKGAVVGTLQDSIGSWAPKAIRGAQKASLPSRVDPLRTRLDGTTDEGKQTRRELMQARAAEIRKAAPVIRDTLYRALAPLAGAHPEFTAATHETAAKQFEALVMRLPRDPGTALARMKSLWAPDAVATERFARFYEVFQNPAAVVKRALEQGTITTEAATALREFNPEMFQDLRLGMLEKLAQPGNLEKMSYHEQVAMGSLLDLTIHSTSSPRFIAAQQAMYRNRKEPQPARPRMSSSNNPSGGRPGGTAAQNITEH